ncbi:adenylate/guanylate cyclase domain-containing protein [Micromonospora auratinigra]|uniref:adenylate/guanylate cyclase domain-containing protein n=1 Tax=Micromonospora auratinigra TaxID=261654 RepID=UPI001E309249|nr:adenylate/guanylate cyclase domain-containing protein [Micromonospora auratinigra]
MPEERRTVSVLFVDIVGSTGLVERLDPEDVRALQHGYFGTVAGVLRRWSGVVEKYIGDAVMALFGAHGSDGFDAYRAVRAGLEIQDALDRRAPDGTRLRIRVGIATGEVVVDLAAARDGGHGTASGAVITTAARLQGYAPPGGVVVCAATRRATAGLLGLRPLGAVTVAGMAQPLDVWRVTGLGRPGGSRHHGPLIGRRRELASAADEIIRALRERRPGRVSLVGPTGSGRSRLLHELTRVVSTVDGAPVRWCVAHCPPYPRGDLAPLADMVRAFAGARDTHPPAAVRRRLVVALDGVLPPVPLGATAHDLADFAATPLDTAVATLGAQRWRETLLALAARGPLVVAVDDLDRAAPPLHRFLHRLLATASARALPLAVVVTHGPGRAEPVPDPAGRHRRVPLAPLRTVETGRLLRHLLGRAARPAALARELLPLVAGNPAAAEAYVRALDGPAGPGRPVPDAVRRMVDARLDRLDGEQRAVLMAGAACPAEFDADVVERLLGWPAGRAEPALRALLVCGVLRRAGRRYAVGEPTVARVARQRLPRTLRAEFTRRARAEAEGCPAGAPARPDGTPPRPVADGGGASTVAGRHPACPPRADRPPAAGVAHRPGTVPRRLGPVPTAGVATRPVVAPAPLTATAPQVAATPLLATAPLVAAPPGVRPGRASVAAAPAARGVHRGRPATAAAAGRHAADQHRSPVTGTAGQGRSAVADAAGRGRGPAIGAVPGGSVGAGRRAQPTRSRIDPPGTAPGSRLDGARGVGAPAPVAA